MNKKRYPFRGFGVPSVYLVFAMMTYIGFAIFTMYLFAQAITSINGTPVSYPGEKTFGCIVCGAILFFGTKRFFHAFQAQKGIPKLVTKTLNVRSAVTCEELSTAFHFSNHKHEMLDRAGTYYIITDQFLWPWHWLDGDTGGTYMNKSMRRIIPVTLNENLPMSRSNINGQEVLFVGDKQLAMVPEEQVPSINSGITFFPRGRWI